jgi:hypothetical protein
MDSLNILKIYNNLYIKKSNYDFFLGYFNNSLNVLKL